MEWVKRIGLVIAGVSAWVLFVSYVYAGVDLSYDRSFHHNGDSIAPVDISEMHISYDMDPFYQWVKGKAEIDFTLLKSGMPSVFLSANIISAKIDGESVAYQFVKPVKGSSLLLAFKKNLAEGSVHKLEIHFRVLDSNVSFRPGGLGFLTAMADLQYGRFFEPYGPTNYEDDAFRLSIDVALNHATHPHMVFANGKVSSVGKNRWHIEYPDYFRGPMAFLHVTDQRLTARSSVYNGLEKKIPITVYGRWAWQAIAGVVLLEGYLKELEATFGPYPHAGYVAYISGSGGMEYAGAAITSLGALGHELTHSWFSRGVIPSDGRSGWIDEAVASWRDNKYYKSAWPPNRESVNLANFSRFERFTPKNCYADGRQLFSELDTAFADSGGFLPVLRAFYSEWKYKNYTTEIFKNFVEVKLGRSLAPIFDRYVYDDGKENQKRSWVKDSGVHLHPPALTSSELRELR